MRKRHRASGGVKGTATKLAASEILVVLHVRRARLIRLRTDRGIRRRAGRPQVLRANAERAAPWQPPGHAQVDAVPAPVGIQTTRNASLGLHGSTRHHAAQGAMVDAEAQYLLVKRVDAKQVARQQINATDAGTKVDTALVAKCQPATCIELIAAVESGQAINPRHGTWQHARQNHIVMRRAGGTNTQADAVIAGVVGGTHFTAKHPGILVEP